MLGRRHAHPAATYRQRGWSARRTAPRIARRRPVASRAAAAAEVASRRGSAPPGDWYDRCTVLPWFRHPLPSARDQCPPTLVNSCVTRA